MISSINLLPRMADGFVGVLQPKAALAAYVGGAGLEAQGIFVPELLSPEQPKYDGPIIYRSEHPHEYTGRMPGVADSFVMGGNASYFRKRDGEPFPSAKEMWGRVQEAGFNKPLLEMYCDLFHLPKETFLRHFSFSVSQYIAEGQNSSMAADPAVPNRYHILVHPPAEIAAKEHGCYSQYSVVDIADATPEQKRIIDFYETVRHLPKLNANHCYLMEFQLLPDRIYFLQATRYRDFSEPNFRLTDEDLRPGEIVADYVRGVTSKRGIVIEVKCESLLPGLHGDGLVDEYLRNRVIYHRKDEFADQFATYTFTERFREASLIFTGTLKTIQQSAAVLFNLEVLDYCMSQVAKGSHGFTTTLFLPGLAVGLNAAKRENLLNPPSMLEPRLNELWRHRYEEIRRYGVPARIFRFRIRSDGRRAHVKRLADFLAPPHE